MRIPIVVKQYAVNGHFLSARSTGLFVRDAIEQTLLAGEEVEFDFSSVEVTQSFIDELIGVLVLKHGPEVLDHLVFKSCSESVRAIIEFVAADRCDQYIKQHSH